MQIERVRTIYFSPVSHTASLARSLGATLAQNCNAATITGHDVTVAPPGLEQISPRDMVILACPVYGGRIPVLAAERMAAINGNGAPAVLLASYGNRAFEDALAELQDLAVKCSLQPVAAAACIAEHTIVPSIAHGRPDKADFASLAKFASALANKIATLNNGQIPPLNVPGKRPYKEFKSNPLPQSVNDNCIQCGECARQCPTAAINMNDARIVAKEKCICCMRCVNVCPVHARHPAPAFISAVSERIGPLCKEAKQNEYFGV